MNADKSKLCVQIDQFGVPVAVSDTYPIPKGFAQFPGNCGGIDQLFTEGWVTSNGDWKVLGARSNQFLVPDFERAVWVESRSSEALALALSETRQAAWNALDRAAGQARRRYITDAPGQAEAYLRKQEQAQRWQASGFSGEAPRFIRAEATALGVDAQSIAMQVIDKAAYWSEVKGPEIEAQRRRWKEAVRSAQSDADVRLATADGLAVLLAL